MMAMMVLLSGVMAAHQKVAYDSLNYTASMPSTVCDSSAVCRMKNCDIITKEREAEREVRKVMETPEQGWDCVEMETVDGICKNGLMEKAIMKEREIKV
jgi:hypothetical protein